ncbi:MAG: hypothetical protein IAE90_07385 [Ignavibacteria bacterium]|nr:hypothetical protein [Ignavibacteria bacterium]
MADFTLLQEAHTDLRRGSYDRIKLIDGKAKGSHIITALLPNYDMDMHNGKPVKWNGKAYRDGNLRKWHDAPQKEKGLKGGVRSGKTFALTAEDIKLSFINRPYFHFSLSPTFDNACETVVEDLKFHCDHNNLYYDWIESKNLFYIYWGEDEKDWARILIHGQDSFWLGVTAASGSANEPFSLKEEKYIQWYERISDPKSRMLHRIWGGTAQPKTMKWGWKHFKEESVSTKRLYTDTIITYGNKYLDADYINGLEETYDTKMREVFMLGKCLKLGEDAAYYAFDERKNTVSNADTDELLKSIPQKKVCLTFDFNVNPMCAVEILIHDRELNVIDEYKIGSSNTKELARTVLYRISKRYDLSKTSFIVTGDATGQREGTRSEYHDFMLIKDVFDNAESIVGKPLTYIVSVPKNKKNPFVHDRVNFMNNLFEKQRLTINDRCEDLIRDFDLVAWKDKEGFNLDKSKKDLTHLSDACGYGCMNTRPLYDAKNLDDSGVSNLSNGGRAGRGGRMSGA